MLFTRPLWLLGVGLSLESMRRGFVGGTSLSLFIIKDIGLEGRGRQHVEMLKTYLEIEAGLLSLIPDWLEFLVYPFMDYHDAGETFVAILEDLVEYQDPANCLYYWDR